MLQKEDGTYMAESLDIVRYLDHLGTPMFDNAIDLRIDTWVKDAWPVALKLVIPRFTKGDFAELATPEAREAYRLREEKAFGDLEALTADTATLLAEIASRMEALASILQDRDKVDMNDIILWPVLRSLSIVEGLNFPPSVRAYTEAISVRTDVPLLFNQAR